MTRKITSRKSTITIFLCIILACSAVAWAQENSESQAEQLLSYADQAYEHGMLGEAIDAYSEALQVFEKLQNLAEQAYHDSRLTFAQRVAQGVKRGMYIYRRSLILTSLADCYQEIGDLEKSLQCKEEANQLMASLGIGISLEQVTSPWILTHEAERHLARGDFESAIDYAARAYRAAVEQSEGPEARQGAERYAVEAVLILAQAYRALGYIDRAAAALQEGLAIVYELADELLRARFLLELGLCDLASRRYFMAEIDLVQALQIYSEAGSDAGTAKCYLLLAFLKTDTEAEMCLQQALAAAKRAELPSLEVDIYTGLAMHYFYKDDLDEMHECLEHSFALCEEDVCSISTLKQINFLMAKYIEETGDTPTAVKYYEKAIRLAETTRSHLNRSTTKVSYFFFLSTFYQSLVLALSDLNDTTSALACAERAKAKTLVDMMETAVVTRSDVLPSDVQTVSQVLKQLGNIQAAAEEPALGGLIGTSRTRSGLPGASQRIQEEYQTILDELERENPALGDTLSVNPERLADYSQDVERKMGEETVALEYFVTDNETLVWVISQDGIQTASSIAVSRDELTEQVRGFREEIENQPVPEQAAASYLSALEKGRDLYDQLIAPVEKYLEDATHLVIIPSDVLFYLPFGALVNCPGCSKHDLYGGKFLIEDYSISYAPSMSSLYWPFQHHGSGTYDSILAVGNPIGDLSAAEEEVKEAAALFPQPTVLIGEQGTETTVKGALQTQNYDVVHLSTHGLFDTTMPLLSELVFRAGGNDDGNLYAGEILGLPFTTNLVVLSACQTALPPELTEETEGLVVGDELQGLSQALFVAGAPSAVLTLWNVNDKSTSQLMQAMYQRLQGGAKKGEALRQAQLALIHDPTNLYYHHPYYWAPFVLYGDWSK